VFAVTALATFVVGLAVLRPAVKGYVATSIIEYHGELAKAANANKLVQASYPNVQVRPIEGGSHEFLISYVGVNRRQTVETLQSWTEQFVAKHAATPLKAEPSNLDALIDNVHQTERAAEQARMQLEAWRDRLDQFHRQRATQVLAPPVPIQVATEAHAPEPNPQWEKLTVTLEEYRAERMMLLIERTPAHPEVRSIDFKIAEIERQLERQPRWREQVQEQVPSQTARTTPSPDDATDAHYPHNGGSDELALQQEGQQLQQAWESAQAREFAAQTELDAARSASPEPNVIAGRILRTPEIVAVSGGSPRLAFVVSLALGSIMVGLAMVRATAVFNLPGVFTSLEQVQHALGLPVVAALTTGDGPPIPGAGLVRKRLLRAALRGVELVLLLCVLACLSSVWADRLIWRILPKDPLQAWTLIVDRFLPF
jgi:hypothetical protein